MSTRALIIGKSKDGRYHYGQTHFDGDDNLEWLQTNMNDVDKVEDFLHYMTEGCDNDESGDAGHGISSLSYEQTYKNYKIIYHMDKPKIDWYDEGYNCGISNTKKAILEMINRGYFDFPEYISYWDGKKWKNI